MSNGSSTGKWTIGADYPSGDGGWWGHRWDGTEGLVGDRSLAIRYDSEAAALEVAVELKRSGRVPAYTVRPLR